MQNQAAVEALYSATFVEDYLDCVENLPNDLQRHLSRLREFDLTQYSVSNPENVSQFIKKFEMGHQSDNYTSFYSNRYIYIL